MIFSLIALFSLGCNTVEDRAADKTADKSYISYQYYFNGKKKQQTLISPNSIDTVHVMRYSKSGIIEFDQGAGFSLVFNKLGNAVKLKITSIDLDGAIKNAVFFDSKRNLLKSYYIDSSKFEILLNDSLINSWKTKSKEENIQFCLAWFNKEGTSLLKEKCVNTTFDHLLTLLSEKKG